MSHSLKNPDSHFDPLFSASDHVKFQKYWWKDSLRENLVDLGPTNDTFTEFLIIIEIFIKNPKQ